MPEDKQTEILAALIKKAEEIQYGEITVSFKIHKGKISAGEVIEKKEKLG